MVSSPSVRPGIALTPASFESLRLTDHRGGVFDFAQALQSPPLLVVFIRGHWCPYCRRYLCKLQRHHKRIRETGAKLVVISPEPTATSAALAQQLGLTFGILGDHDGRAIELFGVRNSFAAARAFMPHPAVFILGEGAVVLFRSIDRNYRKRTSIRAIIKAVQAGIPE